MDQREIEITAEQEKERDVVGFDAIRQLHQQMDDDLSGTIDRAELTDFFKEDMDIVEKDHVRQLDKVFHHHNDDSVTVNDLWKSWFESNIRSWTVEQCVEWLINDVELPQYAESFKNNNIDGKALPRLAVPNSTVMIGMLEIKSPVHRQKLQVKAMDIVLFGYRVSTSLAKDMALAFLLLGLFTVLIMFKVHKSRSRREVATLSSKMQELLTIEEDFQNMQRKIEDERNTQQVTMAVQKNGDDNSEQVQALLSQLKEAERRLESTDILQPLLRTSCKSELSYIEQQRLDCIREMHETMEMVEKLRRKQSSILSSVRFATGLSNGGEDLDTGIFLLKARMESITTALKECQHRWVRVESICNFQLISVPPSVAQKSVSAILPLSLTNGNHSAHTLPESTDTMSITGVRMRTIPSKLDQISRSLSRSSITNENDRSKKTNLIGLFKKK